MAITQNCLRRHAILLNDPLGIASQIELQAAQQLASDPAFGSAMDQDTRDCLAEFGKKAAALGIVPFDARGTATFVESPNLPVPQFQNPFVQTQDGAIIPQDTRGIAPTSAPAPTATAVPFSREFNAMVPSPAANLSLFGDIFGLVKKIPGVGDVISTGEQVARITGILPGGGTGTGTAMTLSCPDGFKVNARGECVKEGVGGAVQRFLPGGKTGTLGDVQGQAIVGAFGVPGLLPAQVGTINGRPILKCPAGMVLGKDDVCYVRAVLPRQFRKWPAAARPPITAGDAKAIRKAEGAKKRVKLSLIHI